MFDAFVKMFTETPLAEMTGLQLVILMAFSFVLFLMLKQLFSVSQTGAKTLGPSYIIT